MPPSVPPTSTFPPQPTSGVLSTLWNQPVSALVSLPVPVISPEDQERHTLHSLLTLALVATYWDGNKYGNTGTYPWRTGQLLPNGCYEGGDYKGHNIACIAVDGLGRVIDFDFNHNNVFDSSVEHAESRLVRRIFSLALLNSEWMLRQPKTPFKPVGYSTILSEVTIYTSLESCSQCSGIMALGNVKAVVFLQRDPGQGSIGNILSNLGVYKGQPGPPVPLPADLFGFPYFTQLATAFAAYQDGVPTKPFYTDPKGVVSPDPSITSFICTDAALAIYTAAQTQLSTFQVAFPAYCPPSSTGIVLPGTLSNADVLADVQQFLSYAANCAHRGTPHKL
jgi:tRNA(Arg) A34 adenosine deaminase TadA